MKKNLPENSPPENLENSPTIPNIHTVKKLTPNPKKRHSTKSKGDIEKIRKYVGRPSNYNELIALVVLEKLAQGWSIKKICQEIDGMPTEHSVWYWIATNKSFYEFYVSARKMGSEVWASEILDISEDSTTDVNRLRLRIDTRKWLLSKLQPHKYGEQIILDHQGRVEIFVSKEDVEIL